MQVKSKGSILQYFRPSLSYGLSLRSLFCLVLIGRFTQVLLYIFAQSARISLNITYHYSFFQAMDVKPDAIALRPAEFYKSHDITVTTDKEVGKDPD